MAKVYISELVLRDGHQSLIATRMRTEDMLPICRCFWHAKHLAGDPEFQVVNLAYGGNIFLSDYKWEDTSEFGE